MIDCPARQEFYDYCGREARKRAIRLFELFGEDPSLFCEAFSYPRVLRETTVEAIAALLIFITDIVAGEWLWDIKVFEDGTYSVKPLAVQ